MMRRAQARPSVLLLLSILGLAGCGAAPPDQAPVLVIAAAPAEPPPAAPAPSPEHRAEAPPVPPPVPSPQEPEAESPPAVEQPPAPAAPPTPPPTLRPPPGLAKSLTSNNGEIVLPGPILFETAKDTLKPESDAVLLSVTALLDARRQITRLRIEGHSDSTGSAAMNQVLTEKRALAVAKWLVARGVNCKRLIAVGFGSSRPIADNATSEGRSNNRRMRIVIAELSGKPVGGVPVDGGGIVSGDPCQ